ncbi:MAG: inositol monophosphatase [Micavibrio aeruginosavorus]|uniref:Inositol monophosphatase n=1 Tax=Micavibrio aeruginosavorus TaxID=349221 RepID=A0A7T5R0V6_9BACT|nr:MAG: inositol monophosphatase [Micavibrio aeruginosavorus]
MLQIVDPDKVSEILREQTALHILPRFRQLAAHEIMSKTSPTDLVTVADQEMERALIDILPKLLPGSIVLGEEGVSSGMISLDVLQDTSRPVWVADPVDGTFNFAHGKEEFCTMLALLVCGQTVMSWIFDPLKDRIMVAVRGSGARINGIPVKIGQSHKPVGSLKGFAGLKYFRREMRPHIQEQSAKVANLYSLFCAGHEYLRLGTGEADFSIYTKVMPWDHLAGQLMFEEAGGYLRQWNGSPYTAQTRFGGILAAADRQQWDDLHALFLEKIIADYAKAHQT